MQKTNETIQGQRWATTARQTTNAHQKKRKKSNKLPSRSEHSQPISQTTHQSCQSDGQTSQNAPSSRKCFEPIKTVNRDSGDTAKRIPCTTKSWWTKAPTTRQAGGSPEHLPRYSKHIDNAIPRH